MTEVEDGVYEATIPDGTWTKLFFCRMNGATQENNWDNNNKWNQSSTFTDTNSANNCISINDGKETWSVYTPSSSGGTISADLLSVLKGDKVMFYYGDTWGKNGGKGDYKFLRTAADSGISVGNGLSLIHI